MNIPNRTSQAGFTLIELMITVTIVAILAGIAVPTYLNYTKRAYYSEIVESSTPYKVGVAECYQTLGTVTGCNAGTNHIPAAITTTTGGVASVSVVNGAITVTPVAQNGILASDTFVLTPTVTGTTLVWTKSGGGITDGLAN